MSEPQTVGNLKEKPFEDVLLWVFEKNFSGAVALAHEDIKKTIIFEKGKVISARSNIPEESLGLMLVAQGKITEAQLQKTLEMLKGKEAMRQGEALIELGLIDHAYLGETLQQQLHNRIYSVFRWPEGKYGLVSKIPEDTARILTDKTIPELCFRGLIEKYKDSPELEKLDMEFKPNMIGGTKIAVDQLKLVGREMGLFRQVTGVNKTEDILSKSRLEPNISKAMLFAFRDLGLIRLKPEKAASASASQHQAPATRTKAKASPPRPKQASSAAMKAVMAKLDEIEGKTLFEVLGLDRKATSADVKKAYFQLAKTFHPDRLPPGVTGEERKIAETLFAKVSEAHSTLTNDANRKEYEASLDLEESGITQEQVNDVLESEVEFQKGQVCIRKGDFAGAVTALEKAVELYDKEPEYYLQLGWALFRRAGRSNRPQDVRTGKMHIEKALQKNEKLSQGYFFLGMIAKSEGALDRAKSLFEKTLQLAPHHNEASSELRVINMRGEKKESGLKGLFKKKS